ncbi:uncharacterized protein LOC141639961 isoform X2 [Silene latifolia]|uniref:uncharacterized protein LOC141639961 isoform X2 n=1 Tax=Silene latifolia TaxID=37657 RepID=UPI003D7876C6
MAITNSIRLIRKRNNFMGTYVDPSELISVQVGQFESSDHEDDAYSPDSMNYYKYGYSEPVTTQYYCNSPSYEIFDHLAGIDEYNRRDNEFCSTLTTEQTRATNQQSDIVSNTRHRNWRLIVLKRSEAIFLIN